MPRARSRRPNPLVAAGALLVALLVACRVGANTPAAESYFPLELGQRWVYDTSFYGPNGRSTTSEVAVCRVRDSDQAGRVFLVSTCADGSLVESQFVFGHGAEVAQPLLVDRSGAPHPRNPPEVIARFDMRVGQEWTWASTIGGQEQRNSRYRVVGRGRVLTPAGEFDGLRVLVSDESGGPPAVVERWYAAGVGLVQEAGVTFVPDQNNQPVPVELVRLLKEHSVVPVESISCCTKTLGG